MKVLVTGDTGYIGSPVVHQLTVAGHSAVVCDNRSTGTHQGVLGAPLIEAELAHGAQRRALFAAPQVDAAMHFAASFGVPDSVVDPPSYCANNTRNALNLMERGSRFKLLRMVFSSTAAAYDIAAAITRWTWPIRT